ncbi:MAG: ABC transporter ATP-binding protein [Candidatus Solibacter usitatus]|nr:ABC transporter ATP-binding protein [Candidatus Solibacter usitatus]
MVSVQHVSKVYKLYPRPVDRLLENLPFSTRARHSDFWALKDVSFPVERGEIVSIVGPNGSGKSTLLQIVAGILQPTSGRVRTEGRIAALLELGAGFNPEFTGRENVFLNGEIMGLSRQEMTRAFPKIAAFAEIGEFLDRPVKEYSTGMYVRLAFATAIHVDPEILIVDEALSVGDAIFASRCVRKFEELKARKVTTLFVSHDLGLVKRLSDRAVFLWNGRVEAMGLPRDVVNRYVGMVHETNGAGEAKEPAPLETSFRHGDGTSRITDLRLLDASEQAVTDIASGARIVIRLHARFHAASQEPIAGILIRNRLGMDVYGTNTRIEGVSLGKFATGDLLELDFAFDCRLARHEYTVTAAMQHADGASQDWLDDALSFRVAAAKEIAGVADMNAKIVFRRGA